MSSKFEKIRERLREKLKKLNTPEKRKEISDYLTTDVIARKFNYRTAKSDAKLIILYGPPGSGKSKYIRDKRLKKSDYVHISIDNIIESIGIFCTQSRTSALQVFGTNTKLTKKELVNRLNKLPQGEVEKISKTYRQFAESKNSSGKFLKDKLLYIFKTALENKKNIILEMTGVGTTWFSALQSYIKIIKQNKYSVDFVFPIVSFEQMWLNYRTRAARQIKSPSECVRFGMFKSKARQHYQQSYRNFLSKWTLIKSLCDKITLLKEDGSMVETELKRTPPKNVSNRYRNSYVNKKSLSLV